MHCRAFIDPAARVIASTLAILTISGCASEAPVSPRSTGNAMPLAAKQSTTNSTILFWGAVPILAGNSDFHVFSMADDGTNFQQLTTTFSGAPSWAPDGKSILFTDGTSPSQHISVMNADGTGITQLTAPPAGCLDDDARSLAKQVVFVRLACTDPANDGIYLMNADGTGLTLLDANGVGRPGPSPKGGRVAYQKADGNIWVLDLGTGGLTNLGAGREPSFSPSAKQIAFRRSGAGIFIMNADGTGVTQLTSGADVSPTWSPDGKRIGFSRFDGLTGEDIILVMNADGTAVTDLTGQSLGANQFSVISAWAR